MTDAADTQDAGAPASEGAGSGDAPAGPETIPLTSPADGVPEVVRTERDLDRAATAVSAGAGPVALDAERASGYRYGQRAYLVQLRREGAGTWLIDPIALPDLRPLNEAIGAAEWILHAATQDLACLAEVGLRPRQLFDTELAARLLGHPRVGLAAVVEHYLGLSLAKEHSAVDWSTRPLPEPWLRYAALDVEVLVEVRNLMGVDLATQGKSEWAREEFDALLTWAPAVRSEPWRRTSGMHKVRGARGVARVRELWLERDRIAMDRDVSPGRIVSDAALVEIAQRAPRGIADLPQGHRGVARYQRHWLAAVQRARELPESELPPVAVRTDTPPPARSWPDRAPVAAARLAQVRQRLAAFAHAHSVPVENVCTPDAVRRVLWTPPSPPDERGFDTALADLGVRPWQRRVVVPILVEAASEHPDEPGHD